MRIGFVPNYVLTADGTTFTVTERDAALTRGAFSSYNLLASPATFVLNGKAAGFPSAPSEVSDFVLFSGSYADPDTPLSAGRDRPDVLYANKYMAFPWDNAQTGDWLDSLGVSQGSTPYATATTSGSSSQVLTFSVGAAVVELRSRGNTGFHLYSPTVATGNYIASSRNTSGYPIPTLVVVTSTGTYPCPLLADIGLADPSSEILRTQTDANPLLTSAILLRFDLSPVDGNVISATLTMQCYALFTSPAVYRLNIADMPELITNAVRQRPNDIELGWSSELTEAETRAHANCIWSPRMDSNAHRRADWISGDGGHTNYDPQNMTFTKFEGYDIDCMRFSSFQVGDTPSNPDFYDQEGHLPSILSDGKYFNQNYQKLYARMMVTIENSVVTGMSVGGIKLPGFDAYSLGPNTGNLEFSARREVGYPSPTNNNAMRIYEYLYGGELGSLGFPANFCGINFCPLPDGIYSYEQMFQLNTFTGLIANQDGASAEWVDGVKLMEHTGISTILEQAIGGISHFFASFFHGGSATPNNHIYFKFGGVVVSDSYIGPPKQSWLPAAGTIATVGLNTIFADPAVNPELDPATNPNYPSPGPWHETGGIGAGVAYSGVVFAPLLGSQGSVLMTNTGHFAYNDNAVYTYNVATQRHTRLTNPYGSIQNPFRNGVTSFSQLRNPSDGDNYSDPAHGEYYASAARTTTLQDQPAGFQAYGSSVVLPPGFGGAGAKGALLTTTRFARSPSGNFGGRQMHILDLDDSAGPLTWERWGSAYSTDGEVQACISVRRDRVYLVGLEHIKVANATTRAISDVAYTPLFTLLSVGEALTARYSEARDTLMAIGIISGVFKLQVVNLDAMTVHNPGCTGTLPTERGGGEWVEEHQAFYYYGGNSDHSNNNKIYKFTMPVGDPKTNAWACEVITLTGTVTPHDGGTDHISRLRCVDPARNAFIWWPQNSAAVQAFRLP